jgi:hypothetical protein
MSPHEADPRAAAPGIPPNAAAEARVGPTFPRNRPSKILGVHLDRLAVVYVRQSSPGQVAHH